MTIHVDRYAFMRWFETGEIMYRDARGVVEVNDTAELSRIASIIERIDEHSDGGGVPQLPERIIFTIKGRPFSEMTLNQDGWQEKLIQGTL